MTEKRAYEKSWLERHLAERHGLGLRSGRSTVPVALSTVAVGAVTATISMAGGATTPAVADEYPSWGDIEQAKQNAASKQAEIDRVDQLLQSLQKQADAAVQASQKADEAYRNAVIALDAAADREEKLHDDSIKAASLAETSKMRAGLIAAHLAKTAGGNFSVELLFSSAERADSLLRDLGTAEKLGEQSTAVYRQALADRNSAESLKSQATKAAKERKDLATAAEARASESHTAAAAANQAVNEQEQHSVALIAQLASLKNTTVELENQRVQGMAREQAARALSGGSNTGGANNAGGSSGTTDNGGSNPPANNAGNSAPSGVTDSGTSNAPNGDAVEAAIAYAEQQLGKPYRLGGAGPSVWDCSGLTKMAYASVGIYIGTHSATNQYNTLRSQGKAVALGSAQRGDLLFWGGAGDYYHVAIYLGGGRILEAPREGVPVREYYIWGSPTAAARPTG